MTDTDLRKLREAMDSEITGYQAEVMRFYLGHEAWAALVARGGPTTEDRARFLGALLEGTFAGEDDR